MVTYSKPEDGIFEIVDDLRGRKGGGWRGMLKNRLWPGSFCCDSSQMWSRAASYLIEDGGHGAQAEEKHVYQTASQAGLVYRKVDK